MTPTRSRLMAVMLRVPAGLRSDLLSRYGRARRWLGSHAPTNAAARLVAGVATRREGTSGWHAQPVVGRHRYEVTVSGDADAVVQVRWRTRLGRVLGPVEVLDATSPAGRSWVVVSPPRAALAELRSAPGAGHPAIIDLGLLVVPPAYSAPPAQVPPRTPLRVAVVGDGDLVDQLRAECEVLVCGDGTASATTLAGSAPDLLLIASPVAGSTSLDELLDGCARHGVPRLLWDRHGIECAGAADVARKVDVVATTRTEQVARYTAVLGHERVHHLGPAAQVDLHNPAQPTDRPAQRLAATALVHLDAPATGSEPTDTFPLDTFPLDTFRLDTSRPAEHGPRPGGLHVDIGPAQFISLCRMYRAVAVTPSHHPDAEQASVHAAACGADVSAQPPSSPVPGVAGHVAYRATHTSQTWTHHLGHMATWCNIALPHRRVPRVGVVLCTCRETDAQQQLEWFADLDRTNVDLHLALLTSFDPDDLSLDHLPADRLVVARQNLSQTLGDHLNRGTAMLDTDYYAKIDDDDRYGQHYFTDMLLAANFSRADVLGKHAHYSYLQTTDTTILRFPDREHHYTHWVAGGTLFWRASVNDRVRFPSWARGSDFGFLRRVMEKGMSIYATDRFNFTLIRRSDTSSHTWTVSDEHMTGGAATEVVCAGTAEGVFV